MCTVSPSVYLLARVCTPRGPAPPHRGTPPSGACWKSAYLPRESLSESEPRHRAWAAVRAIARGLWDSLICRDLHWVSVNECAVDFYFLGTKE